MRIPVVIEIPPEGVEALRAILLGTGRGIPHATGIDSLPRHPIEFPETWSLVDEREDRYTWPQPAGPDQYSPFRVYEGVTSGGTIRLAIGWCHRTDVRGRDRRQYAITFYIAPTGSKRPIAEFLEADNYGSTRDLIAIIKGRGGGAKMYDPDDELPPEYAPLRIETYRNRIDFPGAYKKLGVVAKAEDVDTMLAHTLIQAQTRFGLGPE